MRGTPGSSDFVVEGSSGVLVASSTISTKGGIHILGDGEHSESLIIMDGDGILLEESSIEASSLLLQGYGANPQEPGFIDEDGDLVELALSYIDGDLEPDFGDEDSEFSDLVRQTGTGVEIRSTTIEIKDHGGDFDHAINILGFGGGGNINVMELF